MAQVTAPPDGPEPTPAGRRGTFSFAAMDERLFRQEREEAETATGQVVESTQQVIPVSEENTELRARIARLGGATRSARARDPWPPELRAGSAITSGRPRVLVVVTVYNGMRFVPRCLNSAARLSAFTAHLDVLVLDDCSPEPEWSEWLAQYCEGLGVNYYRTPRNVGIVANCNLGFRSGVEAGYDYVFMVNSDTVLARNVIDVFMAELASDPAIGSVTAWSNNASFYSLPTDAPESILADQDGVDWIGAELSGEFGDTVLDVPAGTGFAMLVPTAVLGKIGYLDTVFGRGYSEETDWTLRSRQHGYRVVVGLGAFVYHIGSASTRPAGLLEPGETGVAAHEAIIDLRYPGFHRDVDDFIQGAVLRQVRDRALHRLVERAAEASRYDLAAAWSTTSPTVASPAALRPGSWSR